MTNSSEFVDVLRTGKKSGRQAVVVSMTNLGESRSATRVGFIVSKAVGNAVIRNTVKRRLRAIMAEQMRDLDGIYGVVVRALPPAAHLPYSELRTQISDAMGKLRAQQRLS